MLSPNDALGLMEDLAVLNASNAGVQDAMQRAARNRAGGVASFAAVAHFKVQEKNQQLDNLRGELGKVANERNAKAASAMAAATVITSFIRNEAARTGESEASLRSRVNYARSRAYDEQVEQFLREGYLSEDPRRDPELIAKEKWYIPEHV